MYITTAQRSHSICVYLTERSESESDMEVSQVHIALIELPTQRYIRRVTKAPLDLLSEYTRKSIAWRKTYKNMKEVLYNTLNLYFFPSFGWWHSWAFL